MWEPRPLTLRITGIPQGYQAQRIKQRLVDTIRDIDGSHLEVGAVHSHGRGTSCCIVTFPSFEHVHKALSLEERSRKLGPGILNIDWHFGLLTTLYTSDSSHTGRPDIDIVALHDLYGHPWYSFASSNHEERHHENWLKAQLPRLLEHDDRGALHARIMSFGYRPDLWITQDVDQVQHAEKELREHLRQHRSEDPDRPLFFIAHGLGGLFAKHYFLNRANAAAITASQEDAISSLLSGGCVFFGVPNQVSNGEELLHRFNSAYGEKHVLVGQEKKGKYLVQTSLEFAQVCELHNLPVQSFLEGKPANSMTLVEPDAGIFPYGGRTNQHILEDKSHISLTKFSKSSKSERKSLDTIVSFLFHSIGVGVHRSSPPSQQHGLDDSEDNKFSLLRGYDTVFLVDDSRSMRDAGRWELVQEILAHSVEITIEYDSDGIDIFFFNNKRASKERVKDARIAMETIRNVNPEGTTPTRRRLEDLLRSYMRRFRENRQARGYNLIVLTDGEPDRDYEYPDEISDEEDARQNSAANRKIRKEIVRTAQELGDLGAADEQIGIQFCQIGNDSSVSKFYNSLDNDLRLKYRIRDMVDTIPCVNKQYLNDDFYVKLLIGAVNPFDDNRTLKHDHARSQQLPNFPPQLRSAQTWQPAPTRQATSPPAAIAEGSQSDPMVDQFSDLSFSDAHYTSSPPTSSHGFDPRQDSNVPLGRRKSHTHPVPPTDDTSESSGGKKKHVRLSIFHRSSEGK